MADRAEATKVVAYVATGRQDTAQVSKIVAYLVLAPGEGLVTVGQGHVHSRLITRSS